MSDRFGEVLNLDDFRSGPRSWSDVSRAALCDVAAIAPREVVEAQLRAERFGRRILDKAIKRVEATNIFLAHSGSAVAQVTYAHAESVALLNRLRERRETINKLIQDLEAALAANADPTNSPAA